MAPTKASLNTLPEELVLAILSDVHNLSALAKLSLTNHRLHRLGLPFLYRVFPGRNSELFLRTVAHHPALAAHTRKAVWQQERKTVPHISPLEKQHIINRLNELCVPHGTDLSAHFAKFGKNDDYWYFEVLLLFMPNVEVVQVKDSWLWDDHHYWFKSLSPFFNPLCVSRLKRVLIEGPMRIENIVPLLTLPSLKVLELTQVTVMRREGYRVFQWSVWPARRVLAERSSALEVLTLRQSYIDLDLLVPIALGIKSLKAFTYEHVPNDLADEAAAEVHRINTAALASCLNMHAHSLEHIRVRDTQPVDCLFVADYLFGAPPADANAQPVFPNLKITDIGPAGEGRPLSNVSFRNLSPPRALPASLEILRVKVAEHLEFQPGSVNSWATETSKAESDIELFLHRLASNLAHEKRFLRVEVVEWNPILGWYPNSLPALQRLYVDVGLRLESVAGEEADFYDVEPLLVDDESEEGWVVVTDLHLATK
ncbi:hypothetical protein E8E12_001389 [Didymella heteroderae]|uniref:F-box domain-containing protein n=1 Tax=Didymella heteroderae TaxID=1769908 RepID=A0A9P5BXK6_9PLEO|nr:hypothetical protein E8E12_001389 [Didymella heteroderae]